MPLTIAHDMSGAAVGRAAYTGGREERRRSDVQVGIQYAGLDQRQQQIDYQQSRDQRNFEYQQARDAIGDRARVAEMRFKEYTQQQGFEQQDEQFQKQHENRLEYQENQIAGRKELSQEDYRLEEAKVTAQMNAIRAAGGAGKITKIEMDRQLLMKQADIDKFYPKEDRAPNATELTESIVFAGPDGKPISPGDTKTKPIGIYESERDSSGQWVTRIKPLPKVEADPQVLTAQEKEAIRDKREDNHLKLLKIRQDDVAAARKSHAEKYATAETAPEFDEAEAWETAKQRNRGYGEDPYEPSPEILETRQDKAFTSGWKKVKAGGAVYKKLTKEETKAIQQHMNLTSDAGPDVFDAVLQYREVVEDAPAPESDKFEEWQINNGKYVIDRLLEIYKFDKTGVAKRALQEKGYLPRDESSPPENGVQPSGATGGISQIAKAHHEDEERRRAGGVWVDSNDPKWGDRLGYWQYQNGQQLRASDPPPR